jgi:hypothetical protein
MPTKLYLKYLPLFGLQFLRLGLSSTFRGKPHVFIRGAWAAAKLHPSTTLARKRTQKSRKVSNAYIDSILIHKRPPKIPTIGAEE